MLNASVYVEKENLISTFSNKSWEFQRTFYDNWTRHYAKSDEECAVVQLDAYTDRLKVNFSLLQQDFLQSREPSHEHEIPNLVDIKFYRVLERHETAAGIFCSNKYID